MNFYKYLTILLVCLFISPVWSANLIESGNKLHLAHDINRRFVAPLKLEGLTGNMALEKILSEGFRCDIEPARQIGFNEPPLAECIKKPSGYAPLCTELLVTLRFEPTREIPSSEKMLHMLDSLKVQSALAFCPYSPEVSVEYLTQRAEVEALLTKQVNTLEPTGNAKQVYEKLLVNGFYCGYTSNESDPVSASKLVCTKRPSGIKFCFESRLTMDVHWDKAIASKAELFKGMSTSEVTGIHSSCEVPAISTKESTI